MQGLIERAGLRMMLIVLCIPVILLIPVSLWLSKTEKGAKKVGTVSGRQSPSLRALAKDAAGDKSYLCVAGAFFTCGFHMVIIETHLFSQYVSYGFTEQSAALAFSVYGVAAMLGCIINGVLDSRFPNKWVLGGTYAVRIPIGKRRLKTVTADHLQAYMDLLSFGGTNPDGTPAKALSVGCIRLSLPSFKIPSASRSFPSA